MKKSTSWLPLERIETLVQPDPLIIVGCLALAAWLIYKVFLHSVSADRHISLKELFKNLLYHLLGLSISYAAYELLYLGTENFSEDTVTAINRILPYLGVITIFWGLTTFVKVCRILFFEYLFFSHMREGVPLLLVNLFTFVMSLALGMWLMTEVFNIQLTAFLATSAMVSVVLGLALQETLGNLFAAVALQFDKPYELGDWIEIQSSGQKWVGQVQEVTWRATSLTGLMDEVITVPNRIVAQSQVSNFSAKHQPFVRSHLFRLPFGSDFDRAKQLMVQCATQIPGVLSNPQPIVMVADTTDSWVLVRLSFFIEDYGRQFRIADQLIPMVLTALSSEGILLASNRLSVLKET